MKKKISILAILVFVVLLINPNRVSAVESCVIYITQKDCEGKIGVGNTKCVWKQLPLINDPGKYTYGCIEEHFTKPSEQQDEDYYREDGKGNDKIDELNDDIPDFLQPEETVSCGNVKNIPEYIPFITSLTITILTIISMGMLVIMGTIDLFKGINSGNPDEMKKNQKAFFNRLGSAALLFFIVALTKLLVGFVNKTTAGGSGIIECISCFINNSCN